LSAKCGSIASEKQRSCGEKETKRIVWYLGFEALGMVARDNKTWERIGNKLSATLEKNKEYSFSIWLCRSLEYKSQSRLTHQNTIYTTPIVLRVWLGNSFGKCNELVATSIPVQNANWIKYEFVFSPQNNANHVCLEAFYADLKQGAYCGNILLDNVSDIIDITDVAPLLLHKEPVETTDQIQGKQELIKIWPNQVSGYLMASLKDGETTEVWLEMSDITTQIVARHLVKPGIVNRFSVSNLGSGFYKCTVKNTVGDILISGVIEVL
jgi:hypothetical protein